MDDDIFIDIILSNCNTYWENGYNHTLYFILFVSADNSYLLSFSASVSPAVITTANSSEIIRINYNKIVINDITDEYIEHEVFSKSLFHNCCVRHAISNKSMLK